MPRRSCTTGNQSTTGSTERIAFDFKNSTGHHQKFRVEGPGMAYGFALNQNEKVPQNWPIRAEDVGKTLLTEGLPPAAIRKPADSPEISLRFRNNSLQIRKVALISYKPGETGNGTVIFTLAPYAVSRQNFPVGTRVYLATAEQVNSVMSGSSIISSKPFLVVKPTDFGKTINLSD